MSRSNKPARKKSKQRITFLNTNNNASFLLKYSTYLIEANVDRDTDVNKLLLMKF